jgi:hypothetical protein
MSLESGRGKVRRAKSSGDSRRRLADQMAEAAAGGRASGSGGGGSGACLPRAGGEARWGAVLRGIRGVRAGLVRRGQSTLSP